MRFILAFVLSLSAIAQTPAAELRANVLRLVELFEMKAHLQSNLGELVNPAKASSPPRLSPLDSRFEKEWDRRMRARINVDEYVAVAAKAYEAIFSNEEIKEFILRLENEKQGKPFTPSPRLAQKIASTNSILGEQVEGTTAQMATKLGQEITAEIEREHPEYFKKPPASR